MQMAHNRNIMYVIAATNWGKGKIPKMQDWWPLPIDDNFENADNKNIKGEREAMIERINRIHGPTLLKRYGKLLA